MIDILIIGAGTAGLSAAIYVERSGKHAVVLEELSYGGQIINTPDIQNYPGIEKISGYEFAVALYNQAVNLGADIEYEKAVNITNCKNEDGMTYKSVKCESGKEFQSRAVIIATGAKNRHLNIDDEERLSGNGISYCATCDGAFFKGRDVAVNGGGNTALEDAVFLSNYCSKVYIIHRRENFRGESKTLDLLAQKGNVYFILNSKVTKLIGEKKLEAIDVTDVKTNEVKRISVEGLFIAIGQKPDNNYFTNVIELDGNGYIKAGENCITETDGIFTAGDCRTKQVRQLTTAAADGAVAALAACRSIG